MTTTKAKAENPRNYAKKQASEQIFIPRVFKGKFVVVPSENGVIIKKINGNKKK